MKKITLSELYENLKKSQVEFSFTKKDGTTRKAKGTLNSSLIPAGMKPLNEESFKDSAKLSYYDLDKKSWRSVSKDLETVDLLN